VRHSDLDIEAHSASRLPDVTTTGDLAVRTRYAKVRLLPRRRWAGVRI